MKKFFYIVAFLTFIIPSFALGGNNRDRAIYFCHRDVESYIEKLDMLWGLGSLIREKDPEYMRYRKEEDDLKGMCYEENRIYENARNFSTKLGKPFYLMRHCFFLIADKIFEFPEQNKIVLSLVELETRGYGKAGMVEKQPVVGGEDMETIKHKPISCVPIVKDNDHDRELVSKQLGYSQSMPNLYAVWLEISNLMGEKEKNCKYSLCGNNCCTPAYDITEKLIGKQNASDLIDPVSFNLLGMGVLWGEMPGKNLECMAAVARAVKGCTESTKKCNQLARDSVKKCLESSAYNIKAIISGSKELTQKIYYVFKKNKQDDSGEL